MKGFHFSKYDPRANGKSKFDQLLDLFMQLLTYTSGDVAEALSWLNELDKKYQLTDDEYGMGDFIEDLKAKGFITDNNQTGEIKITPKTEQGIRKRSLEEIFGKLKKTKKGDHHSFKPGLGDEVNPETRPYQFGDMPEQIDFTESIRNAQINHGIESFHLQEDDLSIRETDFKSQTSTVLMIDISHSMILYGEDRITPAKKVAMALSELITTKYPKDTFGLDRKVVNRCINLAAQCKKLKIPITTFMIATDPYLQNFVQEFTEMNQGKAFFASLDKLGAFVFKDFESGKRKTVY